MTPLRVGVVCDYREEEWPSMELVAGMVMDGVRADASLGAVELRPRMPRPFGRRLGAGRLALNADRVVGRYLAYPRWLRRRVADADVFHVIDHSYAHLVHALPAGRTVVTCHDLDAFRSLLHPEREPRPAWFRAIARRILSGLQRAALVLCDSAVVAAELTARGLVETDRVRVAPLPVPPGFTSRPDAAADARAAELLGPRPGPLVLHVGSIAPRKRLDVLLDAFELIHRERPDARLARVGGPLPEPLRDRARGLPVIELPYLEPGVLSAIYRRADLVLLPSEREGFGLPLLEAMACGAPVAASDLPVLREVGGEAARYAPPGAAAAFARIGLELIADSAAARAAGLSRSAEFAPARFAAQLADAYRTVAGAPG
jgi:glycosyltransferase involved in cell wall biosynthesis